MNDNINLEMMCTKALNLGKHIENIPDTTPFFEVLKEHVKDLYAFSSGNNAIFAGENGFSVLNLKTVNSSMEVQNYEDFIALANYEPFSEIIEICNKKEFEVRYINYSYRFKHLDHWLANSNCKLLYANLKRRVKYIVYLTNGYVHLNIFHLYSSNKNLDDLVKM